ncbi:MAG: hypothetical protein RJA76_1876 [Bacteroidota bacterium]|jgi:hypothetical protein
MHIEIHYLPSIEYISLLNRSNGIIFEQFDSFTKQTYRNRCTILTANGVQNLVVPIQHGSGQKIQVKDIQIDYSQGWQRQHIGAIQSSYGKSAYFEHFAPLFFDVYQKKSKYLLDLNIEFIDLVNKILGLNFTYNLSNDFLSEQSIYFNLISPKKVLKLKNKYQYRQCFGSEFVGGLSVLDLLMNCGREGIQIISGIEFEQI